MQLVGGSLWFIRAPFILEGAFYGFIGALISNTIIFGLGYFIFVANRASAEATYIITQLADLNWPALTEIHYILGFIGILILGMLIGAFNSLIAIRRYIY
jgi:cell division transport system permease protein